jgi:HK97 gp10 family phage protein
LKDSIEARTSQIAFGGRSRFYQSGTSQALGFSGHLRPQDQAHGTAFGIWAAWYYHFVEFGTSRQAPQPFLMPAVEAGKDELAATVQAALKTL